MNKILIGLLSALTCIPSIHFVMVEVYEGETGGYKNYFEKMRDFDGLLFLSFVVFGIILLCCFSFLSNYNQQKKKNELVRTLINFTLIILLNFVFSFSISLTTSSIDTMGLSIVITVLTSLLAGLFYYDHLDEKK